MDELSLDEWRTFLGARLKQEQGQDAEALPVFEALLSAHPRNPHLLAARTYALARMQKPADALASKINAEYSEAGRTLVGPNDRPDQWQAKLNSLLSQLDSKAAQKFEAANFAW